jgi:hypothetical protein
MCNLTSIHGLSLQANYTDWATAACRCKLKSSAPLLKLEKQKAQQFNIILLLWVTIQCTLRGYRGLPDCIHFCPEHDIIIQNTMTRIFTSVKIFNCHTNLAARSNVTGENKSGITEWRVHTSNLRCGKKNIIICCYNYLTHAMQEAQHIF